MAETLMADGDKDDYFSMGTEAAEQWANMPGRLSVMDVTRGVAAAELPLRRGKLPIAAGYLAVSREMPQFIEN